MNDKPVTIDSDTGEIVPLNIVPPGFFERISIDPEGVRERILTTIANAQSTDDVFAPFDAGNASQYVGIAFAIESIEWAPSDIQGGFPVYPIAKCRSLRGGDAITVVGGGENVTAQSAAFYMLGKFPIHAMLVAARRATKYGNKPLHWSKIDPKEYEPFE